MIHYALRCGAGHGFDGWFRDSAAFEAQAGRGLVVCPACGDVEVRRALMAPAVGRKGRRAAVVDEAGAPVLEGGVTEGVPEKVAAMPDAMRAVLQRLRAEVERQCDDVGRDFAAEARRIHAGESERRGIYGETTAEEAEGLAEDGIEVARLPWVPLADS